MLRLFLVGQVAAEYAGEPLPIPSSDRARALVGWLGLHPGPQPRGRVAAALWPDTDEVQARARLRTAVWALRQAWGEVADSVLVGGRDTLGFDPSDLVVDATADAEDGRSPLEGELLPGVEDEWAATAREELRDRQVARCRTLAEQAEAEGRTGDAVAWAKRRCALARFDEPAHRALVRALIGDGDRAGAADVAMRFTERLRTELGVTPSPATRSLHADVEAGASVRRAPSIYGRTAEIGQLDAFWKSTARGHGRVVIVTGEPGIGKTTLLDELARRVAGRGGVAARGSGLDVGGTMPFATWLELARGLTTQVRQPPAASTWPAELNRLSPDLGAALGRTNVPPAVVRPDLETLRTFEASLRLVEWAASQRAVLLVVDDAHHADRPSLQFLAHLGRRARGLPLLLALACPDRPTPELDALADLATRAGVDVSHVVVGPIDASAVAALAASLGVADSQGLDRVVVAAEGNPLLAAESARSLVTGEAGPPPNLRMAVRAATGRLSPQGRHLSALLAAAGRPLRGQELARLGDQAAPAVVSEVLAGGLVSRVDGRLGFRHGLLRDAAYVDLHDPVPVHAALAEAVDQTLSAEVARHWEQAGRADLAVSAWADVAAYARSVGALPEAVDALNRAVECQPERADLWVELGVVLASLGRHDDEERAFAEALPRLSSVQLAAAWCRRGELMRNVSCDPPRSWVTYQEAQRIYAKALAAGASPDEQLARRIEVGLAWNEAVAGDPALAERRLAEIRRSLPSDTSPSQQLDLLEIGLQGVIRQGRFLEAAEMARTAMPMLTTGPGLAEVTFAIGSNAASALVCAGDDEGALEFMTAVVEASRDMPSILAECLGSLAHLQARTARVDDARRSLTEQARMVARLGTPRLAVTASVDAGLVALVTGDYTGAAARLGEALDAGLQDWRPSVSLSRAEALALAGDDEGASAQLRAALQEPTGRADQPWSLLPRVCFVQALIAVARDDPVLARRRLDEARTAWQRLLPDADRLATEGYLAGLLDLGRPPVLGLVEPARELARVEALGARLAGEPAGAPSWTTEVV